MEFRCRLGSASGQIQEGVYVADTETQLRSNFADQGLFVLSLKRQKQFSFTALLQQSSKRIRTREFIVFNQELAALLRAGMPVLQSLDILRQRVDNARFKLILDDIYERVRSGSSLAESFESHGNVFPGVYIAALMAGEKSGGLEEVLRRYVTHTKTMERVRRKTLSALIYPIVLFALSILVVAVIVLRVVPEFSSFYDGMGASLPVATQTLLAISSIVGNYFWLLLAVTVSTGFVFWGWFREPQRRTWLDEQLLGLPGIGDVATKFSTCQLARTLSTLLGGGIPLVSALDVASRSVSNRYLAQTLTDIAQEVREGQSLSGCMRQRSTFPPVAIKMVEVGESTGALQDMLNNVADFFDEEIDTTLTRFMALIEPVLLLVMGVVIAGLLISLYLPLFQLGATV
jgi:type IV pilus assembly protein PilC